MTNSTQGRANRRRGADFELEVAHFLQANGYPNARRELERRTDIGDIAGGPDLVHLECKNKKAFDLAAWIDQAQAAASPFDFPAVAVKRRQRPISQAYVVMELEHFVELLAVEHSGGPRR